MDPVTLAIVAALAGGALSGAVTPPFADAYTSLKSLIQRKFGHSRVPMVLETLEETPDSEPWQAALHTEIERAGITQDQEVVQAADALQKQIEAQPGGEKRIINTGIQLAKYITNISGGSVQHIGDQYDAGPGEEQGRH